MQPTEEGFNILEKKFKILKKVEDKYRKTLPEKQKKIPPLMSLEDCFDYIDIEFLDMIEGTISKKEMTDIMIKTLDEYYYKKNIL